MNHRRLLPLLLLAFLACSNALAGPNLLTNNWVSCSDNSNVLNFAGTVALDSECLFQEIDSQSGDNLNLICDAQTSSFTSAQLAYSDQNFNVLRSSVDSTNSSQTLRANAGNAPQNTRYAVATLFANRQATMNCTLSAPEPVTEPAVTEPATESPLNESLITESPVTVVPVVAGECIDSDNDGFGWNGVTTCIPDNTQPVVSVSAPEPAPVAPIITSPTTEAGACIDSDNDGFGWNGIATCIPDNTQPAVSVSARNPAPAAPIISSPTTEAGACIDSDNDGFGWNGIATCIVVNTQSPTSSVQSVTNNNPEISQLTDLILVTGQSNAQGNETEVSLAVLDAPNNRVFAFTDESGWQVADLRQHWDGPIEVRHPGNNALLFAGHTPHNNFALHFGKSLVNLDENRVIGFVLATAPGAGIRQWDRGSSFYNTLSRKAMTALNASNKISFDGVLWHQGETDFQFNGTSDVTASNADKLAPNYYPDRLYRLIDNLRQEPWFTTNKAVFICGETQTTNPDPTEIAPVNQRLTTLNNDSDPYTGCVSSNGLQTTDGIHFNAHALRELGKRYAEMYIDLKQR